MKYLGTFNGKAVLRYPDRQVNASKSGLISTQSSTSRYCHWLAKGPNLSAGQSQTYLDRSICLTE